MREECVVEEIKDGFAYVGLKRKDNCNGCNACVFGKNKSNAVPAIMDVKCRKGDSVIVELPENEMKFGFAVIYLLPILALFFGFFVGWLFKNEIAEVVCALSFCTLSFAMIYLIDKRFRKKKYMPVVVEIKVAEIKEDKK